MQSNISTKTCNCGRDLPYHRSKYCSNRCRNRAKYQRFKPQLRARADAWIKKHPEKHKEYAKKWVDRTGKNTTYYRKQRTLKSRLFKPLELLNYL